MWQRIFLDPVSGCDYGAIDISFSKLGILSFAPFLVYCTAYFKVLNIVISSITWLYFWGFLTDIRGSVFSLLVVNRTSAFLFSVSSVCPVFR